MSSHPWSMFPTASLVTPIAREAASRLRDPRRVEQAIKLFQKQTQYPRSASWSALSVGLGNVGLAIPCAYLDACFPGEGWDREGRAHLRLITHSLMEYPQRGIGLFSGLCGLAFAAWLLSRGGTRYQQMLDALDAEIAASTRVVTAQMLEQRHGFSAYQYDVISGLAGTGAYLLCRHTYQPASEALSAILRTLIWLSQEEQGVPHWYIPADRIMQERWQGKYPDGLLDCGLAHGVAGPLALLSLAKLEGIEEAGLDEAIERLAAWLAAHRVDDTWGINWPGVYPAGPMERAAIPLTPSRTAWCYGTPGIARALWLAGESLPSTAYRNLAVNAMLAVYRKPISERHIDSPTLCHGIAGLLQVSLRFAHDTHLPVFHQAVQSLTAQMLEYYEPANPLGFQDIESGDVRVDHPGLLTGAPGALLALLATATDQEPTWDRLLLLS